MKVERPRLIPRSYSFSGRPKTSWGLSQFSSDESGTVPLAKVEVVAGRPLRFIAGAALALAWLSLAQAAPEPFTIVAMPDIQNETEHHPEMLQSQITWIVGHRASLNIACVVQQGDITNHGNQPEYSTAHRIMFQLSKVNGLPWGTCPGNHDFKGGVGPALYDRFFGPANFAGKDWCGTSAKGHSSYLTFVAGGRKYLVLNIAYDAHAPVLQWAQGVIDAHAGLPTIINTHDYIAYHQKRSRYGNILFHKLVENNSQVFMVICGHNHYAWNQTTPDAAGKPVFELLADYQSTNCGDGYLRLYQFDEAHSVIHAKTYSPYDQKTRYLTDPYNQFELKMNFNDRLGAAIGSKRKAAALGDGRRGDALAFGDGPTASRPFAKMN